MQAIKSCVRQQLTSPVSVKALICRDDPIQPTISRHPRLQLEQTTSIIVDCLTFWHGYWQLENEDDSELDAELDEEESPDPKVDADQMEEEDADEDEGDESDPYDDTFR